MEVDRIVKLGGDLRGVAFLKIRRDDLKYAVACVLARGDSVTAPT